MLLAALVFALPGLDWSPVEHCEFFAGHMAVTKGELEAYLGTKGVWGKLQSNQPRFPILLLRRLEEAPLHSTLSTTACG